MGGLPIIYPNNDLLIGYSLRAIDGYFVIDDLVLLKFDFHILLT